MTPRLSPIVLSVLLLLAAPARSDDAAAAAAVGRVLAARGPAAGTYGVFVADARTGAVVFDRDGAALRIPASTMKLVTTAAAWLELGPDFRFETVALRTGPVGSEGSVAGDLVIVGGGDPTLMVTAGDGGPPGRIDELAGAIARAGVRRIDGDLVLDAGRFDGVERHPDWPSDQLWRWYCAPVAALTVARSCITVRVEPGKAVGEPGRVTLVPRVEVLRPLNETVTVAARKDHRIVVDPPAADGTIRVRGGILAGSGGYDAEVAVPDPVAVFADVFREALVRAGVALRGSVRRQPGAAAGLRDAVRVASVSTPLFEIVTVANRRSQNLFAECLLKALGREKRGEGSFTAGAAAAAALATRAKAVPGELRQSDGSGLSRNNRVSARFLVAVLGHLYREVPAPERFLATLPAGGEEDGSLSRRLSDLGNDVRAKTGTIRDVSALAGFVRAKSGRVACFAILVNDPRTDLGKARALQDEICRALWRDL
ncbi:MAG: D-alanyl-D-alanine carboxypeptidase/D-alanyl-D-alanine-endopeptidase [Planctomycetes bacterium]|nr:D-alanyl-D-alanine carboxypeptidase/D-alanyl-D-alanine-endopeptidase [Planctomycetota bacterium]